MLSTIVSLAFAGNVFVNGVSVDQLRGQTFEGATVTVASNGDVYVTAPGYRIQAPDAPLVDYNPPVPPPVPPLKPTPPPVAVAPPHWWLVTEDNGSKGHTVQVYLNDALVQTVKSGDAQTIADLSKYMLPGQNRVRIMSDSVSAAGGALYVYVGKGSNESGTVVLEKPEIQYGLGATRSGPYTREYTLDASR
jgi:hypothetical protein